MTNMMDRLSKLINLKDAPQHVQSMPTIDLLWSEKLMYNMINMLEQAIHDVELGHRDGDKGGMEKLRSEMFYEHRKVREELERRRLEGEEFPKGHHKYELITPETLAPKVAKMNQT